MDRRFFLAILLTAVIVLTVPQLLPTPPRPTTRAGDTTRTAVPETLGPQVATPPPAVAAAPDAGAPRDSVPNLSADTVTLTTPLARYAFSTVGAKPLQVEVTEYESLADSGKNVRLARENTYGHGRSPLDMNDGGRVRTRQG